MRIAVIGSGIAGLGAAWALHARHDVTLYEAADRLGGHANTVEIADGERRLPVDAGFIVYNERTYPNLVRLFSALEVPTQPSDMSFAVSIDQGAFEYGAKGLGLLAQPSNLLQRRYRRMIGDILRFCREAPALLGSGSRESTGAYLVRQGYSRGFVEDFLLPEIACIWSSRLDEMLGYPAEMLVRFLDNHGLLQLHGRPRWRTVSGGSRVYVQRIAEILGERARPGTPVARIERRADGVRVTDARGEVAFVDQVVLATHADTTLSILGADASDAERASLSACGFQENHAVLHRDPSLMPRRRSVWSSWNYLGTGRDLLERPGEVTLTYWMNRLQNLRTEHPVFVTLNPPRPPRGEVSSFTYHHPRIDRDAADAQSALSSIQGVDRTWFCGAWTGFGFHEDGLRSGLEVAAALGAPAPWWPASPPTRAVAGIEERVS